MITKVKMLIGFLVMLTFLLFVHQFKLVESIWKNNKLQDSSNTMNKLTKIIHQSWKSKDIPKVFHNNILSWTKYCFKDWTYMFWTNEDNLNLIQIHYPWFVDKYNKLPKDINRADVSRYFYLFHYGGIYTDLDNECLSPFEHLLTNWTLVFGAMEGQYGGTTLKEGYVQNSFMYSRPRHEFWMEMIFGVLNITKYKDDPEKYTGPVLLSNTIKRYRERKNKSREIMVYPPLYFNPFSWIDGKNIEKNCLTNNAMNSEQLQKCRSTMIKKGSYVVQYHAHTWG